MPRLFSLVFFGLILPGLATALLSGLASGLWQSTELLGDVFAEGSDRAELMAIIAEQVVDAALQTFLFHTVIAAPAAIVLAPIAFRITRHPASLIAIGAAGGLIWATFVDYYDSFFTGPGVEWDWPLGGAAFGAVMALIAVTLLRRHHLL